MKRKRICMIAISLGLLMMTVLNISGCSKTIAKAGDLMEGIQAESVLGKEPDEAFVASQMRMSVDMFKKISTGNDGVNKNVLISPLSIQLALAMTANGAAGQTRQEMERVLGGDISIEELNKYLYTYVNNLPSSEGSKFDFANSIWMRDAEEFEIKKDFLQTNANYYNAQVYKEPFNNETVEKINNWVKDNTDGMIDKVINEISPETMMFLANALVFDAEWQVIYRDTSVWKETFTSINGEKCETEMMYSSEHKYLDDGKATGFIKDYKDGKYSFVALLPNEGVDIYDYVNSLTGEGVLNTLKNVQTGRVSTSLPKFKNQYSIQLRNILSELGMPSAFGYGADFSKMESGNSLYIDDVLHKTYIEVDERGTKAGAVTVTIMNAKSSMPKWQVYLNRPFIYMIVDNSTNLPIFMGVVVDL